MDFISMFLLPTSNREKLKFNNEDFFLVVEQYCLDENNSYYKSDVFFNFSLLDFDFCENKNKISLNKSVDANRDLVETIEIKFPLEISKDGNFDGVNTKYPLNKIIFKIFKKLKEEDILL